MYWVSTLSFPVNAAVNRHVNDSLNLLGVWLKDRHQWLGREFRGSLSLIMDKLFLKDIIHELYH